MKKPHLALTVTFFFLVETAASQPGLGPNRVSSPDISLSCQSVEETKPVKKVELIVLDPGRAGGTTGSGLIKLGFLVELEPDWHIYWANPGDAGLAPSVRWTLPPGFQAGPLIHPVPRKSVQEDIVAFEHDGPVLLTCDITPPPAQTADSWEAAAVLEWMACRESCIVGETPVRTGYPPNAAARKEGRALFETFAKRFPRPLSEAGLSAGAAKAAFTGGEWRVEIALSGSRAAEVSDFFPYPFEDFVIALSRISCGDGKVVLPLTPSRGPGAPPPQTVRGLVIIDGSGYELSVPVASPPRLSPNSPSFHNVMEVRS